MRDNNIKVLIFEFQKRFRYLIISIKFISQLEKIKGLKTDEYSDRKFFIHIIVHVHNYSHNYTCNYMFNCTCRLMNNGDMYMYIHVAIIIDI